METISVLFSGSFWGTLFAVYKTIAFFVSLGAIFGIIYVVVKSIELQRGILAAQALETMIREDAPSESLPQHIAEADWSRIKTRLEQSGDYVRMVIEADALCDYVLKAQGYPGETMGERMKALQAGDVPSIDDFWRVHKTRNDIAHETSYTLGALEGERIMETYQRILTELGAL
ncbi:MAG: hypothetical protein A3C84_05365 [Candidatus Ryanbacteria bacterium RIFCSPHIGHO2_02_FULL_48_12]|uniref:DUF4145 domain-containing protein n=1 Tax=Candidatus Ryanbacteria bacterium RIFCSPHIGHO2_01_FULL_48_27 TaxID=1802115 RepID=A0A1G2G5X7_9BACT|nr:MAG: hypothetical protein A2756_01945 [Candidatus Ryanbacteria bacterium RIFCSPHIGHO2_01_FULL_48_27]OGZ50070.1 MAG: hypothetical protein A3C84_05365 [Candidatus Ryanbacteria bacterium RIFCSPHIGHO2_02_FULL_48_12]